MANRPESQKASQKAPPKTSASRPNRSVEARGEVRIGGGEWRNRPLRFPSADGLRPTGDRVRQTVFNWLGQSLHGLTCLDAFAGSGALGFEAASRGATRVVMCEVNRSALTALQDNRSKFAESASAASKAAAAACEIAAVPVEQWLARHRAQFDVVFCDPPFQSQQQAAFLQSVRSHLAPDARVYVEANVPLELLLANVPGIEWLKTSKAGAVYFGLLRLESVG